MTESDRTDSARNVNTDPILPDGVYTAEQVRQRIKVGPETWAMWVKSGKLRVKQLGAKNEMLIGKWFHEFLETAEESDFPKDERPSAKKRRKEQ